MAHHLYTTPALVLSSLPTGEANRTLLLFTRELGSVRVIGKSLRAGKSKLRASLQPLSFADVSLVHGREFWRLTGASPRYSLHAALRSDPARLALAARLAQLLARLIQGEEPHEELYDDVEAGLRFLESHAFLPGELQNLECALVLRVLHKLGYIGGDDFTAFLHSPLSKEVLASLDPVRSSAIVAINRSLRETQL